MARSKSLKRGGLTRREFVRSSSKVGATVAGAALISGLPAADRRPGTVTAAEREIVATRGALATEPEMVARAGAEVLARGGNAADAAAAACLAGCMVHPHLSDLGGYVGSAVVLEAKTGKVWSIDGNSVAPAAASEKMFTIVSAATGPAGINENEYGCHVRDDANIYGPLAVAVPGMLGGIGILWERWGAMKWADVLAPAQRLLEQGFPFSWTADAIKLKEPWLRRYEPSARHLLPSGKVPSAADVWRRPDMEATVRRLVSAGWRDFYDGEIGRKIADYLGSIGGIVTRNDMAAFEPRVTAALETRYRGASVHTAELPNGGLSTLEILNMLECFDPLPDRDAAYWHRLAEIQKLVWRDRLLYLGDPRSAKPPIERFLSKEYAWGRTEALRQFPDHVDRLQPPFLNASPPGTLHVSAGDAAGNVVSITISHGGFFGSCLTVPGTGITLGHGMCRFDPHPRLANSVAAGKKPLNNVAPLVIRMQGRDVAVGLRGGRRIVNVAAQVASRIVDSGASVAEAAAAPRIHLQAKEPGEIASSVAPAIIERLRAMGHELRIATDLIAGVHGAEILERDKKVRAGGNVAAAGVS